MTRLPALLAALALAFLAAFPARAADMLVAVAIDEPGICGNDRVLGRISERFRYQVTHVPNLPNVGIAAFYDTRETRFEPRMEGKPIERRYCHASVQLSDGYSRPIWYLIERPMGFAGFGSNVEFCVSGFDRWKVYGAHCSVLR